MIATRVAHLPTRSVRYLEAGTGHPVILLHAFPLNAEQWLPQLTRVPPGWRMIAPDFRGFGPSEPPEAVAAGTSMESYAADVVELMAHLDTAPAVVVGLSMGGYVAFALLRQAPTRVRALVLADTKATPDNDEARAGRERLLEVVARDGPVGVSREMAPKLLGETSRRDQPDLIDAVRALTEASTSAGIAAGIHALKNRPDSTPQLDSVACPVLVVCGAEDTLTPLADAEAVCSAIEGAQLTVIAQAGHLSNIENPLAFSGALQRFLDTIDVRAADSSPTAGRDA
ncbi:MAG: alpha/beta hydrolase [Vicinamibacterales bacterium]